MNKGIRSKVSKDRSKEENNRINILKMMKQEENLMINYSKLKANIQ